MFLWLVLKFEISCYYRIDNYKELFWYLQVLSFLEFLLKTSDVILKFRFCKHASQASNKEVDFSSQNISNYPCLMFDDPQISLHYNLKHYDLNQDLINLTSAAFGLARKCMHMTFRKKIRDMFTCVATLCCHLAYCWLINLCSYFYELWLVLINRQIFLLLATSQKWCNMLRKFMRYKSTN